MSVHGPHVEFPPVSVGESPASARPPSGEWLLLYILAAVQFSHIMDFVIVMPLGPALMREFSITPGQFGIIVSSYTFSAAVFGFLLAFVIDRYDRKTALLGLYAGFAVSTILCALAPSYGLLLLARTAAGACGGVLTAITYSIVGDYIPESRRGAALGLVMSAFAMASIAGVPFGLYLATRSNWHAPFFMLGGLSLSVLALAWMSLPSMRRHLGAGSGRKPAHKTLLRSLRELMEPNHIRSFTLMLLINMAGFLVIPYLSPYLVANVGMLETELAYLYLVGGGFTLFTSRVVGHLADRYGNLAVFRVAAVISLAPVLLVTVLPRIPTPLAIACTTVFMVLMNARMVPSVAMVTAGVAPHQRGGFMSLNSSVQQIGIGTASLIGGMILTRGPGGELSGYWVVGVLACLVTVACLPVAKRIRQVS
jgi:predicted MFS family arabinose efflux permease